jgi:ATP-dependent Clp protease protease subunit
MENLVETGLYDDFKNYAVKHMGISSMQLYYWDKLQENIYANVNVVASLSPMILEEREFRATLMSVFDRLMMDRIIWLAGPVNDRMSTVVQAQLMFLDNLEEKDITLHIDTPGGSVKSGLSIVDVMNYITSDIITINTGMAASMGSILLGAGTKGKRHSLKFSRVMLHQVSSSAHGHIRDMEISLIEAKKYNDILFTMLGDFCGKTKEEIINDCYRDNWLDSQQTLDYGLIDSVIKTKNK